MSVALEWRAVTVEKGQEPEAGEPRGASAQAREDLAALRGDGETEFAAGWIEYRMVTVWERAGDFAPEVTKGKP